MRAYYQHCFKTLFANTKQLSKIFFEPNYISFRFYFSKISYKLEYIENELQILMDVQSPC